VIREVQKASTCLPHKTEPIHMDPPLMPVCISHLWQVVNKMLWRVEQQIA
jgi:hypothetical protein